MWKCFVEILVEFCQRSMKILETVCISVKDAHERSFLDDRRSCKILCTEGPSMTILWNSLRCPCMRWWSVDIVLFLVTQQLWAAAVLKKFGLTCYCSMTPAASIPYRLVCYAPVGISFRCSLSCVHFNCTLPVARQCYWPRLRTTENRSLWLKCDVEGHALRHCFPTRLSHFWIEEAEIKSNPRQDKNCNVTQTQTRKVDKCLEFRSVPWERHWAR